MKKAKVGTGRCRGLCAGGNRCCLLDNGHLLCVCEKPECICHSRQRYDAERAKEGSWLPKW
jgi:hypothetical protein